LLILHRYTIAAAEDPDCLLILHRYTTAAAEDPDCLLILHRYTIATKHSYPDCLLIVHRYTGTPLPPPPPKCGRDEREALQGYTTFNL
jgi:hypothetical protein